MILINSSPKDALKIFQPFLPISVPIGIGCLLAYAEKENIKARFIDEQIEDNILRVISEYVKGLQRPYIFGFSVLTAALKRALLLSGELKRIYPDSVILFGGIHPTALPDDILAYRHIDAVIRGEGEGPLVEFYKCVKEKRDFTHIPNLSYRNNGIIMHNKISQDLVGLDELPSFPYHLFEGGPYELDFILSSRGCPHRCVFCSNRITTGKKYRFNSTKRISEDLDRLYYNYLIKKPGNKNVQFMDDNLLVNRERIYELLSEIKRKGYDKKLTFSFQARGDNVDHKLLKDLYDTGFRNAFFGIETSSDHIMKFIKKDETVAQCVEAVRRAKEIGFYVSATFIYGFPEETHEDRMNCLKLSKELKLDLVRYNNATPYPGTELYEIAKREGGLNIVGLFENFNSVSTFIENPLREIPFSYVPKGACEKEIRNDLLYSYLAFYFDFNRIKGLFTNTEKNANWFSAGSTAMSILKNMPALSLLGFNILLKFYKMFLNILPGKLKGLFYGL